MSQIRSKYCLYNFFGIISRQVFNKSMHNNDLLYRSTTYLCIFKEFSFNFFSPDILFGNHATSLFIISLRCWPCCQVFRILVGILSSRFLYGCIYFLIPGQEDKISSPNFDVQIYGPTAAGFSQHNVYKCIYIFPVISHLLALTPKQF